MDRGRFSKGNQRMAKQRQHARKRFSQHRRKFVCVPRRVQIMLPQLQKHRSQVAFDLQPMQIHGHFDLRNQVLSVQNAAALLHVQDLNGEDVCRLPQLLVRKKQRRRFFLLHVPPFHHSRQPAQLFHGQGMQYACNIQIRMPLAKIPTRRGAKQNHALQIGRRKFFQPFHQFSQFCVCRKHFRLNLPSIALRGASRGPLQSTFYQLPEAPPPPLLPPPNPPNPPPPPHPLEPPPNPPPPQPPPDPRPEFAIIPSKNHINPLPPPPPGRIPDDRPITENRINITTMIPKIPIPPPRLVCRTRRTGGCPLSVTFESSAMYF